MPDYTREQPKELSLPPRLPLVGLPNQRGSSTLQDSRLINGYVEFGQDDVLRIVKRPGLIEKYTMSGYGAGLFGTYSIFYDSISESLLTAQLYEEAAFVGGFSSYSSLITAKRFFSFADAPTGQESGVVFFHNTFACFTVDSSGDVVAVPFAGASVGPLTCSITSGSTAVTTADTTGLTPYSGVSGAGIPIATYIISVDSATAFTLSANATATNGSASLSFETAGPPKRDIVSVNPVSHLTPGIAVLNKAVYLFSRLSKVAGADADNPYAWQPLNFIFAYVEQDVPQALARQLTQIVALKSTSTEFFRDAGVSPGSPLERVEGQHLDVGCSNGLTVQSIDGTLLWCSMTESGMRSVYSMERLRAVEIASPAVKRALENLNPQYAITFAIAGHSFYALTDPQAGVSMVYDLASKLWYYWNALGETYFPFVAATHVAGETRLQHESNGKIYVLSPEAVDDAGTPITMDIFPPQFDGNTRLTKHIARMHLLADQEPGSLLLVRNTDEDQATGSWTNWREFDLSVERPTLTNCGSFTKRFYHFRHESPTPCRLTAVELEMLIGTL
jgi:hypothetical protein